MRSSCAPISACSGSRSRCAAIRCMCARWARAPTPSMPPTGSSRRCARSKRNGTRARPADPHFENEAHPINLNIGKIEGGDWASSVPGWCRLDCRIAIYPGDLGRRGGREISERAGCVRADRMRPRQQPAAGDLQRLPRRGLRAGARLGGRGRARRGRIEDATGKPLESFMTAGYLDARVYALYDKIPALCYGPIRRTSTASTNASASPRSSASRPRWRCSSRNGAAWRPRDIPSLVSFRIGPTLFVSSRRRVAPEPDPDQTSRFATLSAFSWMNSRRGSTTSPISLTKRSSASVDVLDLAPAAASARRGRASSPTAAARSSRRGPCSAGAEGPCGRSPSTESNSVSGPSICISSPLRTSAAGLRVDVLQRLRALVELLGLLARDAAPDRAPRPASRRARCAQNT